MPHVPCWNLPLETLFVVRGIMGTARRTSRTKRPAKPGVSLSESCAVAKKISATIEIFLDACDAHLHLMHSRATNAQSRARHIAIPMPPPMHKVARPFLASRFCISCSNVTSTRAPDAPTGWPIAIAPPLTLTLAVSQPRSLLTAQACAAKASLASIRSRSPMLQPAFLSAAREAGIGPVPMIFGSTPACPQDTMRASTVLPSLAACLAVISTTAAAPSLMAEAGRNRAVLLEGRTQLGHRIQRGAMPRIFVVGDDDIALARLDRDRNDLVLELAGLLRRLGLVLRMNREFVLLGAGDLILPRDVLGGVAHVVAVEGIPQA